MRLTGLATGMDTETTVKQMMKPYTMRVDKMKQDRQVVAWKQELYRDILADTSTIKRTYFDVLKPDTNMLSKNNYAGFDVTASNSVAGQSAGVSATASVGAMVGSYKVEVKELATAAKIDGGAMSPLALPKVLNKYTTNLSDLGIVDGGTLIFDYNGANKTITVLAGDTISQLMDKINQGTSGAVKLNFSELTSEFSIEGLQTGSSASLKVTENGGKGILTNLKLNFTKDASGTTIPYVSGDSTAGRDAEVTITPPGTGAVATTVKKPGNTFSIDGVNYTLTKKDGAAINNITNITVTGNSQKTYDKIKGFIDKYNELVEKVSAKTGEKKQYKYLPLSDEQKTDMKEDEIKQWETKAKEGLLKGDTNLNNMLNSMRGAFYEVVEGAGISLSEIGISTSSDTSKRGKIILDESKLKAAIETRGDQVASLFTRTSTSYSSYSPDHTSIERDRRSKEEGIFQKLNDILQDYTRTSRNNNGKKGILLEKAGIKGDITEFKSLLSEDIIKKDTKINEMIKSLAAKENKFYLQFSKLETAMNKLNSQSSWLTQQLGGGQ
jgi:flagellar hook-associated protein 2